MPVPMRRFISRLRLTLMRQVVDPAQTSWRNLELEVHSSSVIRIQSILTGEVNMHFTRSSTVQPAADVISGILNCVSPDCGGSMGEPGKEFKCQGECQRDWRQIWERVRSAGH